MAVSTGAVALGEIGDKTQLLALLLVARYRRPWPIAAGIGVATLANHAGAVAFGTLLAQWLGPDLLRWALGLSFIAVALWMLVPDRDDGAEAPRGARLGVFGITVVAFFLAEMGEKTQIATVMLAARYDAPVAVACGSTLGLMLANLPVLWLGERLMRKLPVAWVHRVAALVFATLGVAVLAGAAG